MLELENPAFDADAYLANAGLGRCMVKLGNQQRFFTQGEAADSVYYLQNGRAKLTIVAKNGSEATITFLAAGEFVGEESLTSAGALYTSTATSVTECSALRIERSEMLRVMHEEYSLSERFTRFLVERGLRIQADLVDQIFNSSERRLAKILLLMAETAQSGEFEGLLPEINEGTLAQIIGTTPSIIHFVLHRFSDLGLIDFDGRIRVHRALLNSILHDQMPGNTAAKPAILGLAGSTFNSVGTDESGMRFMN